MTVDDREYRVALRRLVEKGRAAQEGPGAEIDWTRSPKTPIWPARTRLYAAIGEMYHGEMATARMCKMLAPKLADDDARAFLDIQAQDEERHAAFFRRYLTLSSEAVPVESALKRTYDAATTYSGPPEAILLAFHVILESENLRIQAIFDSWIGCPLLRDIGRSVRRDEARHLAFGRLYLRCALRRLRPDERLAIAAWLEDLWFGAFESIARRTTVAGVRLVRSLEARTAKKAWRTRLRDLESVGLVLPGEANGVGSS